MRNSKDQFRSKRPTDEEAKALLVLIKGGWLKLVDPQTPYKRSK